METKKLKSILFLHSSSDLYGASKVLIQSIIAYQNYGFKCILVVSAPGPFSEKLEALGIKVYFIKLGILRRKYNTPIGLLNRIYFLVKAFGKIKKLIKKYDVQIIYSNTTAVIIGSIVSKFTRKIHIWHVHEIITTPRPILWFLSYLMEYASDLNITVSSATFHHWNSINSSLNKKHKLISIFNGLDATPYLNIDAPLIKNNNILVVGMIGRINSWKGQSYFIDIAAEIQKMKLAGKSNIQTIKFIMAGDPFAGYEYLIDELEHKKKNLNLTSLISDLGYAANNVTFFKQIDLLITPSILPDPLPTVVLEAMAAGKPVAATKMGGALDMIIPNETGILIPWDNAEKAAIQIIDLINQPELMNSMGLNGRQRVQSHFSIERYHNEIVNCINSIIK